MNCAKFNRLFLTLILSGLTLSVALAFARVGSADNDVLLRYQIEKINVLSRDRSKLDFAVLGDSSAGNGLSATVLKNLSQMKVENFALTGSYGLAGDLYLMKRLHQQLGVDRFVIIHTPDIWYRNLEKAAILKLMPIGDLAEYNDLIGGNAHLEFFKFLVNPHRLIELIKPFYNSQLKSLDEADFLPQGIQTFANRGKHLETPMKWRSPSWHKREELRMLSDYCVNQRLMCVLMVGPVYEDAYLELPSQIRDFFADQKLASDYFHIDVSVHSFPAAWMGDTIDHVDLSKKSETTKAYWKHIAQYIWSCTNNC